MSVTIDRMALTKSCCKLLFLAALPLIFSSCPNATNAISIQSYMLRDRVIVTDRVLMKKALYVAFSLHPRLKKTVPTRVTGTLWNQGKRLSDATLKLFTENSGTIVFDLPYEIPAGAYAIQMEAVSDHGDKIAKVTLQVQREALRLFFDPENKRTVRPLRGQRALREVQTPVEPDRLEAAPNSLALIVFSRTPLKYVFPASRPQASEVVKKFFIQTARNEFESIQFSIYPLRSLGLTRVLVSDLMGPQECDSCEGIVPKGDIEVATVSTVDEGVGLPEGYFWKLPTVISPENQAVLKKGQVQSFWLTFKIGQNRAPGDYIGKVVISSDLEAAQKITIPIHLRVLPITLEDVPNIEYFMLLTYEMTELTVPWSKSEKEKIYQSAVNVYRDYKEHGMTTVAPTSPFVLFQQEDGAPQLDDIFATLRAASEVGFKHPIIWYLGHLIQTAKPKHPGNILGFDPQVHINRLKTFVKTVSAYAQKNGFPDILYLPIDESDDAIADPKGRRQKITPLLLEAIHESGGKSVLTRRRTNPSPPDYLISGTFDEDELKNAHRQGISYFLYNNDVTTRCDNPAFARYIYGYYTWRNKVDGMSSWTFQTTQNSRGLPTADTIDKDVFLAYPHPKGPLSTLKWEAIREGIDDHKAVYQLVKRRDMLHKKGINVAQYDQLLNTIRERSSVPVACQFDVREDTRWLQAYRERVLLMAVDADKLIQSNE